MWIWELATTLAGVLVVLLIVVGIFLILTVAILTTGFAIANSRTDPVKTEATHPSRHLRPVD